MPAGAKKFRSVHRFGKKRVKNSKRANGTTSRARERDEQATLDLADAPACDNGGGGAGIGNPPVLREEGCADSGCLRIDSGDVTSSDIAQERARGLQSAARASPAQPAPPPLSSQDPEIDTDTESRGCWSLADENIVAAVVGTQDAQADSSSDDEDRPDKAAAKRVYSAAEVAAAFGLIRCCCGDMEGTGLSHLDSLNKIEASILNFSSKTKKQAKISVIVRHW
ncbi:hypothetical protein HPB52_024270 [Rhipicephalus sanguineus]|uniref:Uncharacterized protein n=1 Tax=Rhipicephalus sanguineus TaxID=34632 RepID=A0A9D4YR49_RHISA|nr:hypothetical protein HPB52_024270 [Rhipicephalus sanguineus]